jgi:hypothetical protein
MEAAMSFVASNIAYILLVVAVLYFICFFVSMARARKTEERFSFRFKYFFAFLLMIGFAIYCLVTGQDIRTFIH